MKIYLAIASSVLLACPSALGTTVLWNSGVSLRNFSYGGKVDWMLQIEASNDSGWIYSDIIMSIDQGSSFQFRVLSSVTQDLVAGSRWIVTEEGNRVDAQTTADKAKLFSSNYDEGDSQGFVTVTYRRSKVETIYLGVNLSIQSNVDEDYDYIANDWKRRSYGWIELFADNYTLTLGRSCIDFSGRPVVVGVRSAEPVPEPATGALALLGAALLFRRRIRQQRSFWFF